MNLKLAEYNNKGEYITYHSDLEIEKDFLECGKDFMYGIHSIIFSFPDSPKSISCRNGDKQELYAECYFKDEKDPLNRFNGLFNGRTYSERRFVLIDDLDNITSAIFNISDYNANHVPGYFFKDMNPLLPKTFYFLSSKVSNFILDKIPNLDKFIHMFNYEHVGNIHENPKLFDLITY